MHFFGENAILWRVTGMEEFTPSQAHQKLVCLLEDSAAPRSPTHTSCERQSQLSGPYKEATRLIGRGDLEEASTAGLRTV